MPREVRLSTEPSPVSATTIASVTTSTAMSTTSIPTALALIMPTMRVEAMVSTTWTSIRASVIRRAVRSSGSRPTSGMNTWLAIALSAATTPIAR